MNTNQVDDKYKALMPFQSDNIKHLLNTFEPDLDLIQKEFEFGLPIIIADYERTGSQFYTQNYPQGYNMPLFKKMGELELSELHNLLDMYKYNAVFNNENKLIALRLLRHISYQLDRLSWHSHRTVCQKIEYIIQDYELRLNEGASKSQLDIIRELYNFGLVLTNNIIQWCNIFSTPEQCLALIYGNEYAKYFIIRRGEINKLRK